MHLRYPFPGFSRAASISGPHFSILRRRFFKRLRVLLLRQAHDLFPEIFLAVIQLWHYLTTVSPACQSCISKSGCTPASIAADSQESVKCRLSSPQLLLFIRRGALRRTGAVKRPSGGLHRRRLAHFMRRQASPALKTIHRFSTVSTMQAPRRNRKICKTQNLYLTGERLYGILTHADSCRCGGIGRHRRLKISR